MEYRYEPCDSLNTPVECFVFDAKKERFPIAPHWHYFMEIIIMRKGEALMTADEEQFLLKEGEMILFHPKTVHGMQANTEELPIYDVIKFDINRMNLCSDYAPKFRSVFKIAQKQGTKIILTAKEAQAFQAGDIFSKCMVERKERNFGFDMAIKICIYRLLIGVVRTWNEQGFCLSSEAYSEDDRYDIYNITEYIENNMGSDLRVSDVAEQCGMSYSYFAKCFLRVYGKTCKEYIEYMRIFKVEEFLRFTDFDLNYISQETGFSDCSHMIKSFKRYRGMTPKQFRTARK